MIIATAVMCMAMNVYHEARSEPTMGQYAVAKVTLNRAKGKKANVCDEVFRKSQFSWTNGRAYKKNGKWHVITSLRPREPDAWDKAVKISQQTLAGRTFNYMKTVNHYHTTAVRPDWSKKQKPVKRLGSHVFYSL